MSSYTVDSVALIHYLLDALPQRARTVVERAEDGDATLELPSIVLAETSYVLKKRDEIRGNSVEAISGPEAVRSVLTSIERDSPLELVQTDYDDLRAVAERIDQFSIHDAMIVASHERRNTEAVVTKDGAIADSDVPTIWQ